MLNAKDINFPVYNIEKDEHYVTILTVFVILIIQFSYMKTLFPTHYILWIEM